MGAVYDAVKRARGAAQVAARKVRARRQRDYALTGGIADQGQPSELSLGESVFWLAQVRAAAAVRNDFWQKFDSETIARARRILEVAVWQAHPGLDAPGEDAASAD